MSLLNKPAYAVGKDKLIYDATHPIDANAVLISVDGETDGVIERGQLIDCNNGTYSVHAEGGEVSAIVAESTPYTEDDTEVTVPVYISGTFRGSELKADPELTDADTEMLRGKGIYLK